MSVPAGVTEVGVSATANTWAFGDMVGVGAPYGDAGQLSALIGKPAPDFELKTLEGDTFKLGDSLGKEVVVLDFWATWCHPCVIELPLVGKVTAERADKGVAFFAVNTGESGKVVTKFLEKKKLDVPLVLDDDGAIASAYGVGALPHLVIIDAEGTVRHVHLGSGPGTEERLGAELDALLPLGGQTGGR